METFNEETFWPDLEKLGEDKVKLRVQMKEWGPGSPKQLLAEEWLRRKEQERSDAAATRHINSIEEANRIARSAKNASWFAAIAALIALIVSVVALLR